MNKNIQPVKTGSKNYWVYVLKLEQDKWYVGVSTNPEKRFQQHKNGFAGARFTKKFKPIDIVDKKNLGKISYDEAQKFENKVVRTYMKKYGYNNVRGGDLTYLGNYKYIFNRFLTKDDWESIRIVGVLLLVIALLVFLGR
jgi:predicted GIY-YIG superfamily endonuclease